MLVNTIFILAVGLSPYYTKLKESFSKRCNMKEGQELPPTDEVENKTGVLKESILRSAKYCSTIYETNTLAVMDLLVSEKSDDRNGKCFLNCMLQRYRLMSKQGSYNKDKFKPFLEYIPDSKFLQSIKGNLQNCISEKDPEPCEKAYKFIKCFYTRARNKDVSGETLAAEGF